MKTIDEVIIALEVCTSGYCSHPKHGDCPYLDERNDCDTRQRKLDALYYLKAYQENQHAYEEGNRKAEEARERYLEAVKNCELAENKYKRLCEETSQKLRNTSQITCPKCHSEFVILPDANNPLSWDELRTMGGKPVWVEPCKEWMLITEIETEPHIWLLSLDGMDYDMSLHEWQAYREERL